MGRKCFITLAVVIGWSAWLASSSDAETLPPATTAPDAAADPAAASTPDAGGSREETISRLRDVAYGRDSSGAFRETSARVREAARQALVLMGDDGKPLAHPPSTPAAPSQPASAPSRENPPANQQVDYRTQSDSKADGDVDPLGRMPSDSDGQTQLVNMMLAQPPSPAVQPPSPIALAANEGAYDPYREIAEKAIAASNAPVTNVMPKDQARTATDTASALSQASSTQNVVEVQRRSDITFDPHVLGYKWGEVYADVDGAYWTPARQDMDTMLSKIDPGMIEDVIVIPGPYGVRYGPGLAFIDVTRTPTPRHDCFESNFDSTLNVKSNGGQIYARETVTGGASDWGFRGSYGERDGSDYLAGNGDRMPSAYHAHDAWGEVGYDINPHQHVDFTYNRLDMTNTQIPGQFFNIAELTTNGFQLRVVDDDPTAPWKRLSIGTWYNSTGFWGNTEGNNDPNFPVVPRVNSGLNEQFPGSNNFLSGLTNGFQYSTGVRLGVEFGEKDSLQLRTGADCRYLGQTINEEYSIANTGVQSPGSPPTNFSTNMPQSYMVDPGVYAELSLPVTDLWTVSIGGRVDYVRTSALSSDLRTTTGTNGTVTYVGSLVGLDSNLDNTNILQRGDVLPAFYLTNRCKLGEHWTLTAGCGEAERPPTLIERYSDGIFLSLTQQGPTRVGGDPQLNPERDWQCDFSLASDYENWRGRGSVYFAWVQNYITFNGVGVMLPGAEALIFTNTPMASLAGFEISEEYDVNEHLTPFAKMAYTEGTNDTLGGPLLSMTPLNSVVGLRIHDADKGRYWGLETTVQIVARQTKLGEVMQGGVATTIETPTDAYTVCNLRGYYNYSKNLSFVAGIDNVFNTNYQTALDIRFPATAPPATKEAFSELRVLEPGISPYMGVDWKF